MRFSCNLARSFNEHPVDNTKTENERKTRDEYSHLFFKDKNLDLLKWE